MSASQGQGPSIERDGWELVSAEERHAAYPNSFQIPPQDARMALVPGDAAKLLFDIETREQGLVIDRGVDRMWVIVKACVVGGYVGILDNDPGAAEGLTLRRGTEVHFGPEHVASIDHPPRAYVLDKYGSAFFTG